MLKAGLDLTILAISSNVTATLPRPLPLDLNVTGSYALIWTFERESDAAEGLGGCISHSRAVTTGTLFVVQAHVCVF